MTDKVAYPSSEAIPSYHLPTCMSYLHRITAILFAMFPFLGTNITAQTRFQWKIVGIAGRAVIASVAALGSKLNATRILVGRSCNCDTGREMLFMSCVRVHNVD